MKRIATSVLALAAMVLNGGEAPKDPYAMFPKAEAGYVRYVVEVPKAADESAKRLELLIGKKMTVDCNGHSFAGKMERLPVKGWGYHYYRLGDVRDGPSTRRYCPDEKHEAFVTVTLPKEMQLLRYNSRLGTVVYVPKGFEVRYRIWSAEKEGHEARKF